jgi:protein SCO1/2
MNASDKKKLILPAAAFVIGLLALVAAIFVVAGPGERSGGSGIGGPFALVNQDGRKVSDKDFAGAPFLVFFGFTHCPDICPTTLHEASEVLRALGNSADKLRVAFITVDPDRDTPDALKNYLSSFDPHIVGLTGSQTEIDGVAKAYRAFYRKVPLKDGSYTMDHTALVYLMDKRGNFVGSFNVKRPPQEAAKELNRYL